MQSLPIQILFGIYLGILTGILPALVSGVLGFLFKYITNVSLPGFGVVVLAVALAGINGGLLALADEAIMQSANAATVTTALLVVMMMALYAHSKGDTLGASLPRRISLRKLGEQTLSTDLVDVVAGRNELRIRVTGAIDDIEGYPPLSEELHSQIAGTEWTFPQDLPVSDLEARLAERLRTEFELGDVSVAIDERGRATVAAAPPFSGLSKRVGPGRRAVSVDALVPTGLARGDVVTALTPDGEVQGTVVSARSSKSGAGKTSESTPPSETAQADRGVEETPPKATRAPTASGGEGQVTLSVSRSDAGTLLQADGATVVVEARGTGREYEVISLLRRAGRRFRRVSVRADSVLDGTTLGAAAVRDTHDVAVLAVKTGDGWQFAPTGSLSVSAGEEVFVVGTGDALARFEEAVA